jgi:serine/threonine protein kinase/serine/threonine protein phosphatase PrpC
MSSAPSISVGQYSTRGKKRQNEDSYGVQMPGGTDVELKGIAMVIADGMSAADAGKEASESCVKSFLTDYYCTHESLSVRNAASQILSALNRWLYGLGQSQHSSSKGMVSTFSAMIMKSGTAHIFHVGDSRIYRRRGDEFEQLTTDHRTWGANGEEYLSRAVGIDVNLDVDYRASPVEQDDVYVFVTDGIHDFISDNDIAEQLDAADQDLDQVAEIITNMALDNGSGDNITCQIVRIDDVGQTDEVTYLNRLLHLPFPPDLGPGMVLDGYRIERELYSSSRGHVYLAIDTPTNKPVALKTPSITFEDDPVYLELFIREEWVGKRLNNPHVLKILNHDGKRNFLYTVAEYVKGQTLRQWMDDHPSPDIPTVRGIINQIAAGLRAFHRKDMIHRDLKPENILIDSLGTVKIIDFGSTKIAGLEEIKTPVNRPEMLGTVDYTAPEYHLGYVSSKQADIYSLGVLAYQMLTGKLPYGQGFKNESAVRRLSYTPAPQLNKDVPQWLDGAIHKAVHISPAHRYDLLSEFLVDISQPNNKLAKQGHVPLIEKNPIRFWKVMLILSLMLNLYLAAHFGS